MRTNLINRRDLLKTSALIAISGGLIGLGGLNYATRIEPGRIEISQVSLQLPRLHPVFHGYRIVQISDIHMNRWMNRARLTSLAEMVNRLSPNLIVITGDFISHEAEQFMGDLVSALKTLSAPDGVLGVLGNHDHWSDAELIRQALNHAGVRELRNQAHTLQRDKVQLHIGGIDSAYDGYDRLDQVLEQINGNGAAILLAHEPDYADHSTVSERFDLQVSGHSHGGQVVLPWIGAPFLPQYARKYPRGLYQVGKMQLYTNRGLGTTGFRIRINCRPEITVFRLISAEVEEGESSQIV